jgi:hypothetical protein
MLLLLVYLMTMKASTVAYISYDLSIHTPESIIFTYMFELIIPRHKDVYEIVYKVYQYT